MGREPEFVARDLSGSLGRSWVMARLAYGLLACVVGSGVWLASVAEAGGTNVAVVAVAGRVWVTTGYDVVKLDSETGRIMHRYAARDPFPLELGASDGNIWVSSVENGFVSGALTEIPFEGGPKCQPLVLPTRPVFSLAVGSGTTWALVGPWTSLRLAAVDQATRRSTLRPLHTRIGWIAADNSGETPGLFGVTSRGAAVRLDNRGTILWSARTGSIQNPPIVGHGRVWVAGEHRLYALDPKTGAVRTSTSVKGRVAELAVGGGSVWMISSLTTAGAGPFQLIKIDASSARVVRQASLPGPIGPIAFGNNNLWMGAATPTVHVERIDPTTLKTHSFATGLG